MGTPIIRKGHNKGVRPQNAGKEYPPTRLLPDQVAAILDECGRGKVRLRQRAIIGLLYRTGVEPGEAIDLALSDLDLTPDNESVHVDGGRLAARTLALDAFALALLRPWLEIRPRF